MRARPRADQKAVNSALLALSPLVLSRGDRLLKSKTNRDKLRIFGDGTHGPLNRT